LYVVENFGILNSGNEVSGYYLSMAELLKDNTFDVTVLYVGEKNPQFSTIARYYLEKNIRLLE